MTLCDELYFEINLYGEKSELKKFISFLKSGGLDDFFEFDKDYIDYKDDYDEASDDKETSIIFVNEDYGIEIDELDSDDLLEAICRAGKNLEIKGRIYDVDEDEYNFISQKGDSYYLNADKVKRFNDELDEEAYREESDD